MTANGRVGATAAVYTAAILGAGLPRAVVSAAFGFIVGPAGPVCAAGRLSCCH